MKNILFLFCTLFVLNAKTQYITIPDANFVTFLQETYPNCMNGNQMDTFCINNMVNTVSVQCYSRGITNLTGIQYFRNLVELNCQNNQINFIPSLSNLNFLGEIYLDYNQLNYLPELPNSLYELYFSNNNISCLPILNNSIAIIYGESNPLNCVANYNPGMDPFLLALPLCLENDFINNPNGCIGSFGIMGTTYFDTEANCNFGTNEQGQNNIPIKIYDNLNNLIGQVSSYMNGNYQFFQIAGTYNVRLDTINKPYTSLCQNLSVDTLIVLSSINILADSVNFPLSCKSSFDIGTKSILTNNWVFPGLSHGLKISAGDLSQFYNLNCASGTSGQVQVSVSGPVTYQTNAVGTLTPIVNGNTFTYDIDDFGTTNIFNSYGLILQTDTTAQAGDQICVTVYVTPEIGDNNPSNNFYEYCYSVVNSYDPNMKEVYPVNIEPGFDDYFTYTIHFQNTGTAPAFNIRLVDTLDDNLDLETFQITNYSHYQTANVRDNVLTFHFPNIQLPDSTSNSEGSKGYVQYRIKPKANLALGTQIKNTANIYFDYNAPIVTNTTVNEYVLTSSLKETEQLVARVYPNPMNTSATIQFNKKMTDLNLSLYNVFGQQVKSFSTFSGDKFVFSKESLPSGIYYLSFEGGEVNQRIKITIAE